MAQIVGIFRLGKDAELRFTQGGEPVASLALAFNYGQKGQDNKKPTQWLDASLWGKRAEAMAPYLKKGTQIYAILSEPHIETYQGRNGEGHKLVARVSEIEFAGGGQSAGESVNSRSGSGDGDYTQAPRKDKPKPSFEDLGDDIPFASCAAEDDIIGRRLERRARRAV